MSNQDYQRDAARKTTGGSTRGAAQAAEDTLSSMSSAAGEAAEKVKQAASDTAATLTEEVKQLLDGQLEAGADVLGNVARSAKRAADDLEHDSPQVAGVVRRLAARVDGYADGLRDQTVEQMWQSASDFTRRQPALVFGLAALAGFFALRTFKSSPSISAPSIQPSRNFGRVGDYYGS